MVDFKKAGIHAVITLAIFLAGALVNAIALGKSNSDLKARMEQLSKDNARVTAELSGALLESSGLRKELEESATRARNLEESIRSLSNSNRLLTERYNRLKESIGEFVNEISGFGKEFGEFGERLQDAVRFVLAVSERG